ncbi:MAG TPA: type II toxin-antitoxin system PemK/MazF family toxin [Verrucomicrobiae bacterium]|nr:type II toxin-antitoxin system PemK/MazF family toxin [Verrucomicrobiae bacterium]
MTAKSNSPRRGEIWRANTGGKKHAVLIVSLDQRNASERVSSVLAIPFGSYGAEGPTSRRMEPGETGLPEPSFLKAHFISVVEKNCLIERLPRVLSDRQMREIVAMVNRAIDPDAVFKAQ